jgi:hypothetical protein
MKVDQQIVRRQQVLSLLKEKIKLLYAARI